MDDKQEVTEETPRKKGDCLTPAATMLGFFVFAIWKLGMWVLS